MSAYRCPLCMEPHAPKCLATPRGALWEIEPLLAIAGRDAVEAWHGDGPTRQAIRRGGLTDAQADRWATRLGYHPVQVWGWAWVEAALRPIDAIHAREGWRPSWLAAHDTSAA